MKGDAIHTGRWTPIAYCSLVLAVCIVFGQSLWFDFVNYDDDHYIYGNPQITRGLSVHSVTWAFTHVHSSNWHPLTTLTHMLDCQLYGLKPWGHHLGNVLLHGATAILLFMVLREMTGALWRSAFVTAVFAIHPLRVESVAWVSERKDVLSGLFFMLTLWAYVHYVRGPRSLLRYLTVVCFFALGLLSKPMLVTLPFVLLLLDYWPLRRLQQIGQLSHLLREKVPLLALSAASSVATILAQEEAVQDIQFSSFLCRVGNALVSYVDYLRQLFWPTGLAVFYPYPEDCYRPWVIAVCGGILLITSLVVLHWQRQRPYLLVGWLWYLGMLAPVIGLMQVGSQARADRYTYLPQIGLCIMITWGAAELSASWRHRHTVLGGSAGAILIGLMILAHAQATCWKNSLSLWARTFASTAENPVSHFNLGNALAEQGKLDEAIQHYERALRLEPEYAKARYSLGTALASKGRLDEAVQLYEQGLQFGPDNAKARYNLGTLLVGQGRFDEAVQNYQRSLQLEPENAATHNNLGIALALQARSEEAIQQFQRGVDLAAAQNNTTLADAIRTRLKAYQSTLTQLSATSSPAPRR